MSRERRKLRKSSSMWIDCSLKITRHSKGHSIRCASQNIFLSPFLRCGDFLKTNNFFYHCTNSKPFSRRRVLTLFNIFYTVAIYSFNSCIKCENAERRTYGCHVIFPHNTYCNYVFRKVQEFQKNYLFNGPLFFDGNFITIHHRLSIQPDVGIQKSV